MGLPGDQVNLTFHLINILLCVFNHLHCLVPLLLEVGLSALDLLLLDLHPAINLFLLGLEGAR